MYAGQLAALRLQAHGGPSGLLEVQLQRAVLRSVHVVEGSQSRGVRRMKIDRAVNLYHS